MHFGSYASFILCVFCCTESSLVPYWIVEIDSTISWAFKIREAFLEDLVALLSLTNLGCIGHGPLKNVYEFHYPKGVIGINYSSITETIRKEGIVIRAEQEEILPYTFRTYHLPTDPQFKNQWPWFNTGQTDGPSGLDINVVPIWLQGVSGSGSTVAVVDDGVQITHPDLFSNVDLSISYSFVTGSNDPTPIQSISEYSHGTNCAGEIIMITDNGLCGTGVAYNANLGGIQFLLSAFRPTQQATALLYKNDVIQIYSNSYGPADDGFTVGGPGPDSVVAIDLSANQGRSNLGNIYVFSSGNGGEYGDSCAADGFTNNRHIIGVGSANQNGRQAYYDENCSGKMATTYTYNSRGSDVVTTFVSDECFSNFTGTSASAPLVAGVIALALEVNENLSWRDVQYLVVYTSDTSKLVGEWITNGAGLRVSPEFGFGAIDAEAFVNRARHWSPVEDASETHTVIFDSELLVNRSHPYNIEFTISGTPISYLEHVIFTVSFDIEPSSPDTQCYVRNDFAINPLVVSHLGARRGDAQLTACSPAGTCSILLPKRPRDFINCEGYSKWDFMSVHYWAENPVGNWTLSLTFDSNDGNAILQHIAVDVYGVHNKPQDIVEVCDSKCKKRSGCSSSNSSIYCDSCAENYYRNVTTMECVKSCSPGACILKGTCIYYNGTCPDFSNTSRKSYSIIIAGSLISVTLLVILLLLVVTAVVCIRRCYFKKIREKTRKHGIINDVDNEYVDEYIRYED